MCDFATAVEKTVRVELIVVPIAHGFTFVVDTERVRGRGTRKVDGGHVRRMRVDLAAGAGPNARREGHDRALAVVSGCREVSEGDDGCQRQTRNCKTFR